VSTSEEEAVPEPSHCDACKAPIVGRYVQSFNGQGQSIESRCSACDRLRRVARFEETTRLTTRTLMDAMMSKYDPTPTETDLAVLKAFEEVPRHIALFEGEVWFGGLQDSARKATVKGTSLEKDGFKLLCYTMCGRAMITLEDAEASVTVITTEDGTYRGQMGLQGIDATGAQAVELLSKARNLWASGLRTTEDREVRIAGM
jgi:hypothetical protein